MPMKRLDVWVSYLLGGGVVLSLLATLFDLIERDSLSRVILLLAGLDQLWNAWKECQTDRRLSGSLLALLLVGLVSIGVCVSSFFG